MVQKKSPHHYLNLNNCPICYFGNVFFKIALRIKNVKIVAGHVPDHYLNLNIGAGACPDLFSTIFLPLFKFE